VFGAAALASAAGCGDRSAVPADGGTMTSTSETLAWSLTAHPKLDLLLMIDGSGSMETAQANFKANLGSFMDVLKALPGGLPDLHIAVVTSDLGAGDGVSIQGCTVNGEGGVFRFQPSGGCVSVGFTDPNATFLVDSGGDNPTTNFGSQDITTVLQCIIMTGSTGCGFRHQLGSVARALGADGAPPPLENAGFVRPDALLAIILLTDYDDCTGPPGSQLFNPTSSTLNSMYGPTELFQCNEWGHLCVPPGGGAPVQPSRFAPTGSVNDVVVYTPPMAATSNCQSFEDSQVLTSVGSIADGIKALKADPANQIVVSALVGLTEGPDSEGYRVTWQTPPVPDVGPWPKVEHACGDGSQATGVADPAVRIEQFVHQFGANGTADNFCQANYGNSLAGMATKLAAMTQPPCFSTQVATKPGTATPDCAVTELVPDPNTPSLQTSTNVPMCAGAASSPCWQLSAIGASQCPGESISVLAGPTPPPDGAFVRATCALCVAGQPDPSRGCP
jgi:hypothetical protein